MTEPKDILWHFGQSLAVGYGALSALSTTQSLGNRMVDGQVSYDGNGESFAPSYGWPLTDLVEATRETPRSGMANMLATLRGVPATVVSSARLATAYTGIKKGTAVWNYAAACVEATGARVLGSRVYAAAITHGEADHAAGTTRAAYEADLTELQADVQAKARASTPSSDIVPLFVDQFSAWTLAAFGGGTTSFIPIAQYLASKNNPYIKLVGPKSHLTYAADGGHLSAAGYRELGAMIGKAMSYGLLWTGLRPISVVRTGSTTMRLTCAVPVAPLVLDTVTGSDPGNYGFELDSGSVTAVALGVDGYTVNITFTGSPTLLRYAYTGTNGNAGGPTTGPRGCLRDSDTTSWAGTTLWNRCVHFEETITS